MLRKTKSHLLNRFRRSSSRRRPNINDMPRVERPLSLVCAACGASGKYNVGTVMLDPKIARSPDRNTMDEAVGFTGYFRCRKCDAGGPWELTPATSVRVMAMTMMAMEGGEDVPLFLGCTGTFDKHTFRYATEGEAHLKGLIEREPDRAFLWVRLGNLYSHAEADELAKTAYQRAIELDPTDIEAHFMLGQVFIETNRPLESVPHFHAVLTHARDVIQVKKELRRNLVRGAIESLLEAHAESNGQFDLLPTMDPDEMKKGRSDEPVVIEIREFDLGSDEGLDDLRDVFLGERRRSLRDPLSRRMKRLAAAPDDDLAAPIRREELAVPRNAPCPCGSGHKYKKCCGRSSGGPGESRASIFLQDSNR